MRIQNIRFMLVPVYPTLNFAQPYRIEKTTRTSPIVEGQDLRKYGIKEENERKKTGRKEVQEMLRNLPPYIKRIQRLPKVPGKIQCIDCKIWVNSAKQLKEHYGTARHKSTVAALQSGLEPARPPKNLKQVKAFSKPFYECQVCEMVINSDMQLLQHLKNNKHKKILHRKGSHLVSFFW